MSALLDPRPMTADEVADLVKRVRVNSQHALVKAARLNRTTPAERAARACAAEHLSFAAAARRYDVSVQSVSRAWRCVYGDAVPPRRAAWLLTVARRAP